MQVLTTLCFVRVCALRSEVQLCSQEMDFIKSSSPVITGWVDSACASFHMKLSSHEPLPFSLCVFDAFELPMISLFFLIVFFGRFPEIGRSHGR